MPPQTYGTPIYCLAVFMMALALLFVFELEGLGVEFLLDGWGGGGVLEEGFVLGEGFGLEEEFVFEEEFVLAEEDCLLEFVLRTEFLEVEPVLFWPEAVILLVSFGGEVPA